MKIRVRYAGSQDTNRALALFRSYKDETGEAPIQEQDFVAALAGSSKTRVWLALNPGASINKSYNAAVGAIGIGGGRAGFYKEGLYLSFCYVDPDFRRNGIAKELTKRAQDFTESSNAGKLIAEPWNLLGQRLCESTGFKLIPAETYLREEPARKMPGKKSGSVALYGYPFDSVIIWFPEKIAVWRNAKAI